MEAGIEQTPAADPSGGRQVAVVVVTSAAVLAVVAVLASGGDRGVVPRVVVVALAVGAVWCLWRPPLARLGTWVPPVLLSVAAVVLALGLRPRSPVHLRGLAMTRLTDRGELARPVWGRVRGDDLASLACYVGVAALVVGALAAIVVARRWRPPRRPATGHALAGMLVALAVVPVGMVGRGVTDRVVEADSLHHELQEPAVRLAAPLGPFPDPPETLWQNVLPPEVEESNGLHDLVDAAGWDVVVGYDTDAEAVVAIGKADGEQRWRWARRAAPIGGVVVDAEAGRVLVLSGVSAVVLDLADGREVSHGELPFRVGSLVEGYLVGPDTGENASIVTGPVALVAFRDTFQAPGLSIPNLVMVKVATAQVTFLDDQVCDNAVGYAAIADADGTLVMEWASEHEPCPIRLLQVGLDGDVEPVAEIEPPPLDVDLDECGNRDRCAVLAPVTGGVAIVAHWSNNYDIHYVEALAVVDGEIRWRAPAGDGHHGGPPPPDEAIYLDDQPALDLAAGATTIAVAVGEDLSIFDIATGQPRAQRSSNAPARDLAMAGDILYTTAYDAYERLDVLAADLEPLQTYPDPIDASGLLATDELLIATSARGIAAYPFTPG